MSKCKFQMVNRPRQVTNYPHAGSYSSLREDYVHTALLAYKDVLERLIGSRFANQKTNTKRWFCPQWALIFHVGMQRAQLRNNDRETNSGKELHSKNFVRCRCWHDSCRPAVFGCYA